MEQQKIQRINELAKKQREEGLSDAERAEQQALREEYLRDFRAQFRGILDNTVIQNPDGSREAVKDRRKK